jgi:hypothetical protein
MTQAAVIYRWNSLSRQYKSESSVGNPLFPKLRLVTSGDASDRFIGGNRLVELWLGGIRLEETAGAGQEKIEGRNALADIKTTATGRQKEEREEGCKSQKFPDRAHNRKCIFEDLFGNLLMKPGERRKLQRIWSVGQKTSISDEIFRFDPGRRPLADWSEVN